MLFTVATGRSRRVPLLRPVLALIGGVAVVLAGCAAPAAPPVDRTVTILTIDRQLVSQELTAGFQAGVGQVPGVRSASASPTFSDGWQTARLLEDLATTSPDGVTVFTLAPDLIVEPVVAAAAAGVPLIAVDNPLPAATLVKLFVGNDNVEMGEQLAEQVVTGMATKPTSGTVVIGTTAPGAAVLDHRANGMRAAFERLLPGVTVLGPFDTKEEPETNRVAWEALVAAHPEAVAFVGTGNKDAYNLAAVRQATGATWAAGAFDLDPRSLAAVRSGDLVVVSPEHYLKGVVAGRLQALHAGNPDTLPQGWIYIPGLTVTRDNVDEIVAREASDDARLATWFRPTVDRIVGDLPAHSRLLKDAR